MRGRMVRDDEEPSPSSVDAKEERPVEQRITRRRRLPWNAGGA